MFHQAPQSARPIIWNRIATPSSQSPEPLTHIPRDAYGLKMQSLSPDIFTSSSSVDTPSESSMLRDMFLTLPDGFEDIRAVQDAPRPADHPRRRTEACKECRRRKAKCGENKNVRFHEQRGRSALLTQDQCHRASKATRSEQLDELGATKMNLFIKEEELKEMKVGIARLKKEKEELLNERKELLERLGHPPVRVSGCYAYLVRSDDLTPHQATSYFQHGIW